MTCPKCQDTGILLREYEGPSTEDLICPCGALPFVPSDIAQMGTFQGITGNSGDYSHLILQWGERTLRVNPDGLISIDGTVTGHIPTIGQAFCDWADYMAATVPAHPSADVTAPDPGRKTVIPSEPEPK